MVAKVNRLGILKKIAEKLLAGVLLSAVFAYGAQADSTPSLITDTETEEFLQHLVEPIFKSAGVPFDPNKIFILNDQSLNAFVSNGNYLFVHTGTLIGADNVNQLNGILAHETGHIAGGHIARQKLQLDKLRTLSVASLLAAGAAAVASGRGDTAMAVVLGSQSGLINSMTAYQLQEERSADESAVRYLAKINQSPEGLGAFMKKIQQRNMLSGYEEVPYFRTHPMSVERMRFFEEKSRQTTAPSQSAEDENFEFVKAKLTAFLLPLDRVEQAYPKSDSRDCAVYARAIAAYRQNRTVEAVKMLDGLAARYPNRPFFNELKGQFLFEIGQLPEAKTAYEQAWRLRKQAPDIILGLAQIVLELPHTKQEIQNTINNLNVLAVKRPTAMVWMLLARAYDENSQKAEALYASARYSIAIGRTNVAKRQIKEAEKATPSASLQLKLNDLKELIKQDEKENRFQE